MIDDYHSDFSSVSKTMLNMYLESREDYYLTYITRQMQPKQPKQPMLIGTVLHAMLLEDKPLDSLVLCYPDSCLKSNGDLNGKPAKAFREDNPGVICFKQEDYQRIAEAAEAVMKRHDSLRRAIRSAIAREARFDATIKGLPCKCKPDVVLDQGNIMVAYDLKCQESVHPNSFKRSARNIRYWLQDAHYSAVLREYFGKPVAFRFCCLETKFPYRVQWYWYDASSRETARDEHKRILTELKECYDTDVWGDRWDNVVVLDPWDIERDELVEVEQ